VIAGYDRNLFDVIGSFAITSLEQKYV